MEVVSRGSIVQHPKHFYLTAVAETRLEWAELVPLLEQNVVSRQPCVASVEFMLYAVFHLQPCSVTPHHFIREGAATRDPGVLG